MKNIIRSIKISLARGNSTTDDNRRPTSSKVELEEEINDIVVFLKRYRATYESNDLKQNSLSSEKDATISDLLDTKSKTPKNSSAVDFYIAQKSVPEKASYTSVMEFIVDCYASHWNTILRNGNDSIGVVMMRQASKKKFIQRTNDFRVKSLIDFLGSSPAVAESADVYLFGLLIGLQPKVKSMIRKAWSHIATSVFVASFCDRCLKNGCFQDASGSPSAVEFKEKLSKATTKIVTSNLASKAFDQTHQIAARKAIKVLELLMNAENPYWSMTPLSAACVEYNCSPPWGADSISKLLNVLLFVALYGSNVLSAGNQTNKHGLHRQHSLLPRIKGAGSGSKQNSMQVSSTAKVFDWGAEPNSPSRPTIEVDFAPTLETAPSSPAYVTTDHNEAFGVAATARSADDRESSTTSGDAAKSVSSPTKAAAAGDTNKHSSKKANTYRGLNLLASHFWDATLNKSASSILSDKRVLFEYLGNLHKFYLLKQPSANDQQARKDRLGFIPLTFEDASLIIQNLPSQLFISIAELALICIHCWQAEHQILKTKLSKGTINIMRRSAIAGYYDSSQASMTATERLALTRLLHWYNYLEKDEDAEKESIHATVNSNASTTNGKGMNWDDVQWNYQQRNFPFEIPQSLINKSRNELNFLAESLRTYIREYDRKNALEDSLTESGPYSKLARGVRNKGNENAVYKQTNASPEDIVSVDEIVEFRRSEYLKSQSLGGDGRSSTGQNSNSPRFDQEVAIQQYGDEILTRINESRSDGNLPLYSPANDAAIQPSLAFRRRPQSPALSGIGYTSPAPTRIPINIVDVIDVDSNILSNVHLLSRPATPHNNRVMESAGRNQYNSHQRPRVDGQEHHFIGSGEPTPLEIEIYNFNSEMRHSSRHGNKLLAESASTPNNLLFSERIMKLDSYSATVDAQRKAALTAARYRVQNRMESNGISLSKVDDSHGSVQSAHISGEDSHDDTQSQTTSHSSSSLSTVRVNQPFAPNARYAQHLDLKQFIDKNGEIIIDLKTHMSVENPTKMLSLRSANVSQNTFKKIIDHYLKPKQLKKLIRLDVSGNRLSLEGAVAISSKLRNCCHLVHLNINGMAIGDMGLKVLFTSIIDSGGQGHLLRLDMQGNGITLATSSFASLSHFKNLRALDLATNNITLDTKVQLSTFRQGMSTLSRLESFSLANNKIQDNGFALIHDIIIEALDNLKVLDVAECFVSSISYHMLLNLLSLQLPNGLPRMDEIMFQNNLFNATQVQEVHQEYGNHPRRCKLSMFPPHRGIEVPR
eukprot:CAMPEP_0170120500 /NCGR_PEP_ID=MMETSP0020_2-20130122/15185_1 /TAXON_ID=98059 /ORGANISM="Dinobryon sp., Strain UTEXLB2267" /LENGTH=1275 /DNA_ID=CAMNT_0010350387 /DNA_START=241 /DNA_END=4064 /DNA_ORIENTATION=+